MPRVKELNLRLEDRQALSERSVKHSLIGAKHPRFSVHSHRRKSLVVLLGQSGHSQDRSG
jgi:hypothetical protein